MATVQKTYSWTTGMDGWIQYVGSITTEPDGSGALKHTLPSGSTGAKSAWMYYTTTWEEMGVPVGARVQRIECKAFKKKMVNNGGLSVYSYHRIYVDAYNPAWEFINADGDDMMFVDGITNAVDADWVDLTADGIAHPVSSVFSESNTEVLFDVGYSFSTAQTTTDTADLRIDELVFEITYEIPDSATELGGQLVGESSICESRVLIFDKSGKPLTELVSPNIRRTWKLNKYGEATFKMSFNDAKTVYEYMNFGNLIYIEHNKLPVWAGMIDTPRTWNMRSHTIEVKAYGAEYLLTKARLPKTLKFSGVPGAIFKKLIEQVKISAYVFTTNENVWGGSETQNPEYHYGTVYDAVVALCKNTDADFRLLPVIDKNDTLSFEAHFYDRLESVSPIMLYEGKNIGLTDEPLVEDGPIANDIIGYGDGANWGSRITDNEIDLDSMNKYGIMQSDIAIREKVKADIVKGTQSELKNKREPRSMLDIEILDVDSTFEDLELGRIYDVQFYSCGFDGAGFGKDVVARLVGFVYEDNKFVVEAILEEELEKKVDDTA